MIGETGERKSAVATPDGKSRKKKKNHEYMLIYCQIGTLMSIILAVTNDLDIAASMSSHNLIVLHLRHLEHDILPN